MHDLTERQCGENAFGTGARSAGGRLLAAREEIILSFEAEARATYAEMCEAPIPILRDHLPDFLWELAHQLVVPDISAARASMDRFAREHANQRREQTNFSLSQVLDEYGILRKYILRALQGISMTLEEQEIIHRAIDQGMARAGQYFMEASQAELENARQKLDESHQLLLRVVDQMPAGFALADAREKNTILHNAQAEKLLGHELPTPEPLNELHPFGGVHDDGTPFGNDEYPIVRALKGDNVFWESLTYRCGDGQLKNLLVSAAPVRGGNGNIVAASCVFYDVTEKKKLEQTLQASELRFQRLFDSNVVGIVQSSLDGKIYDANDCFLKSLGYTREEFEREGLNWRVLTPSEHAPLDDAAIAELQRSSKMSLFEKEFFHKDGSRVPVLLAGASIEGTQRVLCVALDISERKKIENELRANKKALSETNALLEEEMKLRERFIASLTHDLRNPISAAMMSAELLLIEGAVDTAQFQDYLQRIIRNMERCDRMIQDLLDTYALKDGRELEFKVERGDLRGTVERSLSELALLYGERFNLIAPASVPGAWNEDGIKRILENLCGNAVKYGAPQSPISVTLECAVGGVLMKVHNWGDAIPTPALDRLFEPFHRTTEAKAGREKGWGIGLALVKGIVEAHGGCVCVDSSAQDGTTFTAWFPSERGAKTIAPV